MKIENINSIFERVISWVLKKRLFITILFIGMIGLSVIGLEKISMKTSFDDYFMKDDPMLIKSNEFKSIFGNDYYVAVLVKNKDLFSKHSLLKIRELSNELVDSLSYADKITSLTDLEFTVGTEDGLKIEQIVPDEIPSDQKSLLSIKQKAYSKPYLANKLVSKDATMTWILVKLRPFPEENEWRKISDMSPELLTGKEVAHIINKPQYQDLSPNAAGMPYLSYEKNIFFQGEMGRLMLFGLIASILVMFVITRSFRGILTPLLTSVSGLVMGLGIIGWTGLYLDTTTMMIVLPLSFACSIAYNVHLYNLFKTTFLETGKRKFSVIKAIGGTGWGILLSALTTIAAMLTFLSMEIVPMQAIGVNSSLCLASIIITCLFMTPIILSLGKDHKPHSNMAKSIEGRLGNTFQKLGGFVVRKHKMLIIVSCLVTVVCGIGLFSIEPAFDLEKTVGRKVPYAKRFLDLCNTELGSMYSYDLMITLPEEGDAKLPDNLKKLEQLSNVSETYALTKRHNSILDIIKDMNCTLNENNPAFYKIPDDTDMIAQLLLLYENAGGTESEYWMDYDYKRLRLQIEIQSYNSNEAEKEMRGIQAEAQKLFSKAHVSMVGNLPQFTMMQQYVERGQMLSVLLSVLIIGIILLIVFRSWKVGLVGMIPNIAPALIVGGMMGWLDYPLDMMTASLIPMILGLSVDDTIHFINHGCVSFNSCKNYTEAIKRTFRSEGVAIVMSTVIITIAFLGYLVSDATQIHNWGILAGAGMVSALLADLFLAPILFKYLNLFGKENPQKATQL